MDMAKINGELARMRNDQAKLSDMLCELAEELSDRSKRLDQKIDDATPEEHAGNDTQDNEDGKKDEPLEFGHGNLQSYEG